jgi:hypothetical protein
VIGGVRQKSQVTSILYCPGQPSLMFGASPTLPAGNDLPSPVNEPPEQGGILIIYVPDSFDTETTNLPTAAKLSVCGH